MIAASVVMAELYSAMKPAANGWGDLGQITLPQVLGLNHWIIIACFVFLYLLFVRWAKKKGL